jgi:hypothetical protein
MVVDNFHVIGIAVPPFKANTPLAVDSDAILPDTMLSKFLQPIRRWHPKVLKHQSPIQHAQFPQCDLLNVLG